MKVIIKNFQSIEECELDIPEKGFTCLVGPSNIGKSAIRRAIECLLYNKSEKSFVRTGTDSCSVKIILDDGTNIEWVRDKKSSSYVIDGETYSKLSKGVPQILLDKGFKELVLNKDHYSVQVASQFNNIFLLNQSGSKVTEVFSNLGNLNRIINANKVCLSDLKSNKSKMNVRRGDLSHEKERIKQFRGLDFEITKVQDLKDSILKIKTQQQDLSRAAILSDKFQQQKKKLSSLSDVKDLKTPLCNIDLLEITKIKDLYKRYIKTGTRLKNYKSLLGVNEVSLDFEETLNTFISGSTILSKLTVAKDKIKSLRGIPHSVESFEIPLEVPIRLKDYLEKIKSSKEKIMSLRGDIKENEQLLGQIISDEKKIKAELKVCPLCDKEF